MSVVFNNCCTCCLVIKLSLSVSNDANISRNLSICDCGNGCELNTEPIKQTQC